MKRFISVLLSLAFFSACMNLKDLEVKEVKGFSLKRLDPSGMQSTLQLSIHNPNRFGFVILPSTFDVKYSGIYLGKASLAKKVKIKGKEEHTYTFELENDFKEVNFLDLLNLLQHLSPNPLLFRCQKQPKLARRLHHHLSSRQCGRFFAKYPR